MQAQTYQQNYPQTQMPVAQTYVPQQTHAQQPASQQSYAPAQYAQQPASAPSMQPNYGQPQQQAQSFYSQHGAVTQASSGPVQARTLPAMRVRKNADGHIFIDADTYQTAILNTRLPIHIRLEPEAVVKRTIQVKAKREATNRKNKEMQQKREEQERLREEALRKKQQQKDSVK